MFSKLFNRRQPKNSFTPRLESQPTSGQPTAPKPESRLVQKLKNPKKVTRPSQLGKKDANRPGHTPKKGHKSDSSDESFGNLAPGPFTAEDYEFRRPAPITTHQNLPPHQLFINVPLPTDAPSTTRAASPKWAPVNPSSAPLATTLEGLANPFLRPQQPALTSQVEAEPLAIRRRLAELSAVQPVVLGEAQELRAVRTRRAVSPGRRAPSFDQRHGSEAVAGQPAEEKLVPAVKAHSKAEKQRKEQQIKWWEMGGDLGDTKRHIRKDAVDSGNPSLQFLNLEGLDTQIDAKKGALGLPKVRNSAVTTPCSPHRKENVGPVMEQACSLKRGRANRRREPPRKHQSSNQPRKPTAWPGDAERAPFFAVTNLLKDHDQERSSKCTGAAQFQNHDVEWLKDEGSYVQASTPGLSPSSVRQPLNSLEADIVLNGGAQSSPQAGLVEDSDANSSSQEDGAQSPTPGPYLWFEQKMFTGGHNPGPAQL